METAAAVEIGEGTLGDFFLMISTAAWKSLRKKTLQLFHSYHRPGGD